MLNLWARCWHQPDAAHTNPLGYDSWFQRVTPDANGYGTITFPANSYPHGPITITLNAWDGAEGQGYTRSDNCYLQLYNNGGVSWSEGLSGVPAPPQAAGMSLAFSDDFNSMPTISRTGAGTTYTSVKASGDEYGDAIMADYGSANNPFFQAGTYLKIETAYRPGAYDPMGWNRNYTTGHLSSMRQDGTSFHTTGGRNQYFECRFLAAPNPGCWPAFWTLTAGNYVGHTTAPCDELDIIEGYVGWPDSYHSCFHTWGYGSTHTDDTINVTSIGGGGNINQTFHTYGLKITQSTTYVYFDNVQVLSRPTLQYSWSDGNYFMIDNELKPNDALLFGTFQRYGNFGNLWVDWVRVYQS